MNFWEFLSNVIGMLIASVALVVLCPLGWIGMIILIPLIKAINGC